MDEWMHRNSEEKKEIKEEEIEGLIICFFFNIHVYITYIFVSQRTLIYFFTSIFQIINASVSMLVAEMLWYIFRL
jgi:hypothetical protein